MAQLVIILIDEVLLRVLEYDSLKTVSELAQQKITPSVIASYPFVSFSTGRIIYN
jgi:hypothetical protein